MSNKEKLLYCPFCGARTKLIHIENVRYREACEKELEQAKRKADKLWNKRVL